MLLEKPDMLLQLIDRCKGTILISIPFDKNA